MQSMKTFIYPSLLQKQAIPALKNSKSGKNVVIRYREMNGIKLTVLLPLLHNQIKHNIMEQAKENADEDSSTPLVVSIVLCHTQLRAAEMTDFAKELTEFCSEIVEVVNCDEGSPE